MIALQFRKSRACYAPGAILFVSPLTHIEAVRGSRVFNVGSRAIMLMSRESQSHHQTE